MTTAGTERSTSALGKLRSVRAWDWPTRAFHWCLVFCIASAWVSFNFAGKIGDPTLIWHRWNGYAILVLVVFRLIWGVAGSSTSRLSALIHSPKTTATYAVDTMKGRSRPYLGHNPLGSWMIIALLLIVATQSVLGLFTLEHNELVAGPLKRTISDGLTEFLSKWHVRGFNIILAFVAMHVLANSLYGLIKKDPLIRAMVTGEKPAIPYADAAEARIVANVTLRAALCLLASIATVFGTITVLGGRIL
jgi:cytochrome b